MTRGVKAGTKIYLGGPSGGKSTLKQRIRAISDRSDEGVNFNMRVEGMVEESVFDASHWAMRSLLGDIESDAHEMYRLMAHFVRHDDKEHVVLGRALMHALRNMDIHVFVTPWGDKAPPDGMFGTAYAIGLPNGRVSSRHIEINVPPRSDMFFYILLHEAVHHFMGHTIVWTSMPHHLVEYNTDKKTLEIARPIVSLPYLNKIEAWARNHTGKAYRNYVNQGLTHHASRTIADFGRVKMNNKTRWMLVEREMPWNPEQKTSSISTDQSQLPF